MPSLVTCLQCRFTSKKIEEKIHIHKEAREKDGELFQFQSTCSEAVSLANKFVIKEKWSQSCEQKINWNNSPSKTVMVYTQKSVYSTFFDIPFAEMKPFSLKNREDIMNYVRLSSSMIKTR